MPKDEKANKFANALCSMANYFDKELGNQLIDLYWENLKEYTIEDIEAAFSKAIATLRFFPKIVEVSELMGKGPGRLEDTAQIQADLVVKAIRRIGGYRSVNFNDPVTKAVIVNCYGGWIQLCTEQLEVEEKWFRKDFVRYYQSYHRQNIRLKTHLTGRHEIDNRTRGFLEQIPEPIQVETALIEDVKQLTKKLEKTDD